MNKAISTTLLFAFTGMTFTAWAKAYPLKVELDVAADENFSASLDFYNASDFEGHIRIGAGYNEDDYLRQTDNDYTLKVLPSGKPPFACYDADHGGIATIPHAIQRIHLDINAHESTCDVLYLIQPTLTMKFFLHGNISEENAAVFTVKQYDATGEIPDSAKKYPFSSSENAWPVNPATVQDMDFEYQHAQIIFSVKEQEVTCSFGVDDYNVDIAKVDIEAIVSEDGNLTCNLHENFTGSPPVTPEILNINVNANGIANAQKVELIVAQYNDPDDTHFTIEPLVGDYLDTPHPFSANIYDDYQYVKLAVRVQDAQEVTYVCEFTDGIDNVKNLSTVYVNFDAQRSADTPLCLLYKEQIKDEIKTNFNFQGTGGVRFEFFNVLNGNHEQSIYHVDNMGSEIIKRPIFTEYSYIILNELGTDGEDVICLLDGSKEIPATINEIQIDGLMVSDEYQCILSQSTRVK